MANSNQIHPATIAARANGAIDSSTGGLVPGIGTATTFIRDQNNNLLNSDNIYGRDDSDVVRVAENIISALEGAKQSLLFPSGMAAIAAVIRSVKSNGKIILQSDIYWGTTKWVREFCQRRGIELKELDCSNTLSLQTTISNWQPDIVFIETPSNPWLKVTDIRKLAEACRETGSILIVDSTAATPMLTQPLSLGADIVVHSATKVINGHSDVLAGVLCVLNEDLPIWQAAKADRHDAGAIIGNFEAWLLIRGIRTLPLRVERMCENASVIAKFLDNHPQVEKVMYPGLPSHPSHQLAREQMNEKYGYLLSFLVRGDREKALNTSGTLELIHRATSLGGVESLIEHRETVEADIAPNLLRLSVGIENVDDLIGDLDQALNSS